jgi:hypothetical protein
MNRSPCKGRNQPACESDKDCEWIDTPKGSLETSCRKKKKVEVEEEGSGSESKEVETQANKTQANKTQTQANKTQTQANKTQTQANKTQTQANKTQTQANKTQTQANETPTNKTPEQSEYNTKEMIINLHVVNDKAMGNIIMLDTGNKYTIDGDKISLESTMSNLELHNEMDILCNNMNATRISFIETLNNPQYMLDILQEHLEGYKVELTNINSQTSNDPNVTEIPFKDLLINPNELASILNNKLDGYNVEITKCPFIGNLTTNNMIIQLAITNKKMFNGTITMINTQNQYTIKDNEIVGDAKKVDNFETLINEHCEHMSKTTIESKHPVIIMFDNNYDTLLNNIQNALIINGYKISVMKYKQHRPN